MKKPLIIITGPTAVGKTEISIELAKAVNGEIISADSIQVYKYMDIGSAKITPQEMQGIKHYLIDELDPRQEFNVYKFKELAVKYMEEIYKKGKIPIIVGGTGFYIQSILYDIDFTQNDNNPSYRRKLEEIAVEKGNHVLHEMLQEVDEKAAGEIHENNVKRVIRALEYFYQTGEQISLHNEEQRQKESNYSFAYIVLNDKREKLYQRINNRVDILIENGLVEEVKKLKSMGYERDLVSMQGIGYKEIFSYLDGELSLEEAIEKVKQDTRHFAKRQITWFKREKEVSWVNYDEFGNKKEEILKIILKILNEKGIKDGDGMQP